MFRTSATTAFVLGEYIGIMRPGPTNLLEVRTKSKDVVIIYPFSHEISLIGAHDETVWNWADGRFISSLITVSGGSDFISVQYDGVNIWTLEPTDAGADAWHTYGKEGPERVIRRWRIEEFMCVLKDSWIIKGRNGEIFNSNAFAVEHYYNRVYDVCGKDAEDYGKPENTDLIILEHPHAAFFQPMDQVYLKSTLYGYYQDVPILETVSSSVLRVATPLNYTFFPGDLVLLRRDLYLFNDYSLDCGAAKAALYHFDIPYITAEDPTKLNEPIFKKADSSSVYKDIHAATFLTVSGNPAICSGNYAGVIGYIRGAQLLICQPNLPSRDEVYPGGHRGTYNEFSYRLASMHLDHLDIYDNVRSNSSWTGAIAEILDMTASVNPYTLLSSNLYTLQKIYTYERWSYGVAGDGIIGNTLIIHTLQPSIASLAIFASPVVAEENGSPVLIYITVRDQFGSPMNYKKIKIWLGGYVWNGSYNSYTGAPEYVNFEPRLGGYFVCPESISECYQGSFTWQGSPPHTAVEILSGSQSKYPGGPANLEGWVVVQWNPGTVGTPVQVLASVHP